VTRCRRRFGARVLGILLVVALAACADEAGGDPGIARSTTPAPQAADVAPAPEPGPEVAPGRSVGAASPQERLRRVTLVAGGDVLVHSAVWESARTHAGGEGFDFAPMFEPIAAFVAGADLAICHLEVPLSADNAHLASYPRFSAPFELADGIRAAGFDGCSVASNHVLDQGVAGIDATLDHLDRVGLGHAGAARTPEEAHSITTYEVRGTRIAHLSYTYGFNGLRPPQGEEWRSNLIHVDTILDAARRARDGGADLVVLSLHWGTEYVPEPDRYQRDVAAALAPSPDIDLIVGHHAHVVQPLDIVGGTWVAYGLGNLVSNMLQPERRDGALLVVTFEAPVGASFEATAAEFVPTWVELPGHRVVVAPPDSWERTAGGLTALGAPVTPLGVREMSQ
jgi:poly-gamma-glutamate capsule biosynthesis protein CapA/YwtB (metallophosphatase superfamily)